MALPLRDALQQLGASRVEASLVAVLLPGTALDTSTILAKTGLRQPEVSVGMAELRRRGWVEARPVRREGKGRPMYRYRLRVDPREVYSFYKEEGEKEIGRFQKAIDALRQTG